MWFYFIRDLRCEASKLIRNLVAHIFKQKVLNFCENSYMEKQSNFRYVTFYPPHENLVLEIKLIPGVVRVFTSVCPLFRL
jgi:hypothetical protein